MIFLVDVHLEKFHTGDNFLEFAAVHFAALVVVDMDAVDMNVKSNSLFLSAVVQTDGSSVVLTVGIVVRHIPGNYLVFVYFVTYQGTPFLFIFKFTLPL